MGIVIAEHLQEYCYTDIITANAVITDATTTITTFVRDAIG